MACLSCIILLVGACSLLLVGAVDEFANPEVATLNLGLSGRLANSAFLIARLEKKLNETWSRVRHLQTTRDPNELLRGQNGIQSSIFYADNTLISSLRSKIRNSR